MSNFVPLRGYLKITLAPILWGGSLVAGRYIANDLPAITITWVRFSLVALFLLPTLRVMNGSLPRPTRRDTVLLFALTIAGVLLFNVFLFSGLQTVTAVRSSVIIAFAPSVVALILALVFREPTGRGAVVGIAVAFLGAVITITNGNVGRALGGGVSVGDLFLLGCVLSWAVYTLLARAAMRSLSAFSVLTYSSVLGAVILTPLAVSGATLRQLTALDASAWGAMLYLSIGAAGVAYLFYYQAIRDIGPKEAAVFLNLEPVSAIVLGIVLLGETLTVPIAIGAVLVIVGLYLVNRA